METYHFIENKHLTSLSLSRNSSLEHYPGGMLMPGRSYSSNAYRFGFNGKENDNEIKGVGNSVDYGARIYDPRAVRWLSVEPLFSKYPYLSPYCFANNNPILYKDVDGRYFTGNTDAIKAVYATVCSLLKDDPKNARALQFKAALEKMDASDVEFNVQNTSRPGWAVGDGEGGSTSFDQENNRVVLDIYSFRGEEHKVSAEGRTAHELEHGEEFLEGDISFKGSGPDPAFYDKTDEEKAFQMQNLITNTQLKPDESPKTDENAKGDANNYAIPGDESTISPDQAEAYKSSSQKLRTSVYNYKPTEKQKAEKKQILDEPK